MLLTFLTIGADRLTALCGALWWACPTHCPSRPLHGSHGGKQVPGFYFPTDCNTCRNFMFLLKKKRNSQLIDTTASEHLDFLFYSERALLDVFQQRCLPCVSPVRKEKNTSEANWLCPPQAVSPLGPAVLITLCLRGAEALVFPATVSCVPRALVMQHR